MAGRWQVWIALVAVGTALFGCGEDRSEGDGDADSDADVDADGDTDADADADGDGDTDSDADGDLPDCSSDSAAALAACVERDRYLADLELVTGERPPGSPHHGEVRELCRDRLLELGYEVELQDYGTGVNVVGILEGSELAAERVLVSAHYDHIPDCPGADDNASGVAGALESARVLAQARFQRTLVIACWDEEEDGMVGSEAYAVAADAAGEDIVAHFVYEMIGVKKTEPDSQSLPAGFDLLYPDQTEDLEANDYRGDFVALVFDEQHSATHVDTMLEMAGRTGLRAVDLGVPAGLVDSPLIGDLRRSDHAPFWLLGLPGIMITDTANFRYAEYHCRGGDDVIANLDHDFATQVIRSTVGAAAAALEVQ